MDQAAHNKIVSFIWGIADDVLRDLFVRGKLVHDLWNIDKHAELDRTPRSGSVPQLRNLSTALALSPGPQAGSTSFIFMDARGKITTSNSGSGSLYLSLLGEIVDDTGKIIAEFSATCQDAVKAWENELRAAGVPLP